MPFLIHVRKCDVCRAARLQCPIGRELLEQCARELSRKVDSKRGKA